MIDPVHAKLKQAWLPKVRGDETAGDEEKVFDSSQAGLGLKQ